MTAIYDRLGCIEVSLIMVDASKTCFVMVKVENPAMIKPAANNTPPTTRRGTPLFTDVVRGVRYYCVLGSENLIGNSATLCSRLDA